MNFYTQQILDSVSLLFLSADGGNVVALIGYLLGAGGLIGGAIAFLKFPRESGQILITSAQGVAVMQKALIEILQQENQRLRERVIELEKQHETKG